jgi:tetratricopeptide (TPR) repeat protein
MIGLQTLCCVLALSAQPPDWASYDAIRLTLPSMSYFRHVTYLAGGHVEAYSVQEIAQRYWGDNDRAVRELTQAIKLKPKDPINYNNRGLAYIAKRDYEKALKDFSEAIRLNPDNAAAYTSRGELYATTREYEKAVQDLTKAIGFDPQCLEAFQNRGRVHLKMKKYDMAIRDITGAIALNWDAEPSLFLDRGIAYSAKGDSDNAIVDFSEAIAIQMTSRTKFGYTCPQAYFHRGIAYLARKKYHLGFDDLKEYWRAITEKASDRSDDL